MRHNFTIQQKREMRERSGDVCEAGKGGTSLEGRIRVALKKSEKFEARFIKARRKERGPCCVDGCDRGAIISVGGKLVCNRHYQKHRFHGTFTPTEYTGSRYCVCANCGKDFDRGYARSKSVKSNTYCTPECRSLHTSHIAARNEMDRFNSFFEKRGVDDCWIWSGQKNKAGYGCFNPSTGGSQIASRRALESYLGRKLREGHMACHTCDNPPCVNPLHLYEGTKSDNIRDYYTRGRYRKTDNRHAP